MAANREIHPGERKILLGAHALGAAGGPVEGGYTDLDGERFYRIRYHDRLAPFFMSLVSHSNHWMFISSNGALTCGRRNPDHALFPYTTDDKIHDAQEQVGPRTVVLLEGDRGDHLWEPLSIRYGGVYETERNLYTNIPGNKLVFEEINRTLKVSFRYAWLVSEQFGFVRRSRLSNLGKQPVRLRWIDGVQNLLPASLDRAMQNGFSTLVDAYKRSELLPGSGIGIYALSSVPVDRAEPSESLTANTVWSIGLDRPVHLLSGRQLDAFRRGGTPTQETETRGVRGAYFVQSQVNLEAGEKREWFIVADVDQDACAIAELERTLRRQDDLVGAVLTDLEHGTTNLRRIVAAADGIQAGGDALQTARHFSNTLFNVMRGGIPDDGYTVSRTDLAAHLESANRPAAGQVVLDGLPERFAYSEGLTFFQALGHPDLERLYFEYLPLTFSRRHGDPSRPWNTFSIETRNPDGSTKRSYQGNWRDIFQNWEALGLSYPEFLEGMAFKFLNASTADGYNPYRITQDGIDWEVHDPDDPWSNIGYWGDHQIIYLLKLLEHSEAYHPGRLRTFLSREIFAYASVPYRIKPYEALLANPHETIEFDHEAHEATVALARTLGSDGKLVQGRDSQVLRVNLTEKLLVPLLAKLANFIPEAGIWMNTQRPEWNDAQNALVGYGVSMVTLYYLRRYLGFCHGLFQGCGQDDFKISVEVVDLFRQISGGLQTHRRRLPAGFDPQGRRAVLDAIGGAGSRYRDTLYRNGLSGEKAALSVSDLIAFLELTLAYVDQTIDANRRDDGLCHAYNLMQVDPDGGVSVRHLDAMLEGQVAVLSSGSLDTAESLTLLKALRASSLYRADQHSYLLYPDRDLPRFMEKNCIPETALADRDPRLVLRDCRGILHFDPSLRNAAQLAKKLDAMDCPAAEREQLLVVYEAVFDHRSFTGRSGSFFKYEGLGCIYWHMVSKLLLAVQEICIRAKAADEDPRLIDQLMDCYRDIQAGTGAHKSVTEQGAFPIHPYSHTPAMMGAQQPGLTGQVKEDIIIRLRALGLRVEEGCIRFDPFLLPASEYANGLAFTVCAVEVTLSRGEVEGIRVVLSSGETRTVEGLALDADVSRQIFTRSGTVQRLEVAVAS